MGNLTPSAEPPRSEPTFATLAAVLLDAGFTLAAYWDTDGGTIADPMPA